MTDTRSPELTAESRLVSDLMPIGILVAKPYYEQMGADLLGFMAAAPNGCICRIQSKYRDCTKRAKVEIPAEYVEDAFLLYLHLVVGEELYQAFLLPDDIRQRFASVTLRGKDVFRLSISPRGAVELGGDPELALTPKKLKALASLMRSSTVLAKMYRDAMSIFSRAQKAIALGKRARRLQDLIHRVRVAELQKEATEAQLALMQQLLAQMEAQMTPSERKAAGLG